MITFQTENSTYEVDPVGKLVRRSEGDALPTPRFGADNVWRPFKEISLSTIGAPVVFTWPDGGHTITSPVTLIAAKG